MKIASAVLAANSRPCSESPAWNSTGWPCGVRGSEPAPWTVNCAPRWSTSCTDPGRRNTPFSRSTSSASSDQLSQNDFATSTNSAARAYRSLCARNPPRRKFSPVKASEEVTMFHAARPPERWSSDANCRATSHGSLNVVLMVPARPRCVVAAARVFRMVKVSGRPITSRSKMRPCCSRSRRPSARNRKSNSPRSAVLARCTNDSTSMWLSERGSLHTVVLLTPGKCAPRWTCLGWVRFDGRVLMRLPPGRTGCRVGTGRSARAAGCPGRASRRSRPAPAAGAGPAG